MVDIQPNKLGQVADGLLKQADEALKGIKELKSPVAKDVAEAAEVGKNANLAPLAKDGVELGGHESPSPNIKMTRQPMPKAILDFLEKGDIKVPTGTGKTQIGKVFGNEPIEGLVTQDISTMITPASDKAKLLKDVAEAEAKYKPNITTFIGDEPIKGVVTQDISAMILPKHNIIDRPDLRDK